MELIVKSYNETKNNTEYGSDIELEITYHIMKSADIYKELFNKLNDLSNDINIIENIDIYYKNNIRVTKVFKHGVNTNDDIIIQKKSLLKPYKFNNSINKITSYRLKLNSEEVCKIKDLGPIERIRIKLRVSFILKDHDMFKVDLDLVKNIESSEKNLKEIKNMLFKKYEIKNMADNINYSLFDEMVMETEFNNNNNDLSSNDINSSIEFVKSLFNNKIGLYQSYIYKIARKIINNDMYLENFKERFGLKKLLNNVIELNSEVYYKNIIPDIQNYYVTDKIDGQRCICYIEEYQSLINIKLLTNKLYQIKEYNDTIITIKDKHKNDNSNDRKKTTILDCEIIFNSNKKDLDEISESDIFLYIFDIISLDNNKIAYKPFEERIKYLETGYNKISKLSNVNIKQYVKLTSNYKNELKEFYDSHSKSTKYEIDGLIFVPNSNITKGTNTSSKFKINSNYSNMIGYKWKPIEHMTIDFFVCKLPFNLYNNIPYNNLKLKQNDAIYILFSGISKSDYEKFKLSYMLDYKKIVDPKYLNGSMYPIQFTTSDNIYNYIYTGAEQELHNRICEFGYDIEHNKWKFKKIRTDRDVELERGDYFGNYYKIAENIWNNINNPLTFDMLISDNTSYFINDNNDFYKAQRSFNSFVKTYTLESIISEKITDKNDTDFVIDLAAGKGQDVARLSNLGFKTGLFIDNDKNALSELLNRKHNLKTINKNQIQILIKNIDLKDNYSDIIKKLTSLNIKKESADVIICNFAIHYIIINEDYLLNLIKLLDYYLKPNGRFIFTCFDGERIFNMLKSTDEWNSYENNNLKYSIKKLYKSDNLTNYGQKIDVLLPFSNNEYYTEYLMNISNILNIFNMSNFTTEISLSFDTLLDNFKHANEKVYNELSKSDKEFIGLYQFNILKKNQSNSIISKSNLNILYKNVMGGNEYINNNIMNMGNIKLIEQFPKSNRILLIINCQCDNIINNCLTKFTDKNYKNFYKHKKNKNNIIKIVGFVDKLSSYKNIFLENNNYDSIILFDKLFDCNESYDEIMIKKSSIPIILTDANNKNIIVINNELLNNIYNSDVYYENINDFQNIKNYLDINNELYIHN